MRELNIEDRLNRSEENIAVTAKKLFKGNSVNFEWMIFLL